MRTRYKTIASGWPRGPLAAHGYDWGWVEDGYFYSNSTETPYLNCVLCYNYREQMDDTFPFIAGRPFNPVIHTKVLAAIGNNDYRRWDGYYYGILHKTDWTWDHIAISPSIDFVRNWAGGISSTAVDWDTSILSLAQMVRGLLKTKTLLSVSFLELPKTIQMVKKPFGLLKPVWRSIAKDRSARKLAKENANLWLEGQYGWNATYNDMKNFSSSLSKYLRHERTFNERARERFRAKAKISINAPSPTCSDSEWSQYYWSNDRWASMPSLPCRCIFSQAQVRGVVSCSVTDRIQNQANSVERFLHTFGLDGASILETLWELTPYSFVVDWFINTEGLFNKFRLPDALNTLATARVRDLGYSTKVQSLYKAQAMIVRSSRWSADWSCTVPIPLNPREITVDGGYVSNYQRINGYPENGIALLKQQGLQLTQLISGSALLSRLF